MIMGDIGEKKLSNEEGRWINLRLIKESDASITLKWRLKDRARFLNSGSSTEKEQADWIKSRPSTEFNYIIELKTGAPVGMLSLIDVDTKNLHAQTARFLIGEEDLVKGIPVAVEAMKLLYQVAFDRLKLKRLYGTVASKNKLMIKWQKYLGMKEEGVLRQHYFINNEWQDAIALGLLDGEYFEEALPKMNRLINA
ncbi:GNAT family N-acetyltransferase [Polynucleobacter sp. JS-Polo-80-F4]|nr:GNAT family N-acetyltransferase [Polynucleobacter sp. JS-Polo-80-F4]